MAGRFHTRMALGLALAAGLAVAPGTAKAQVASEACRDAGASPALCVGVDKVAERASAECRRPGALDEEACVLPAGHRVSAAAVDAYEASWVHRALGLQYALASDVPFVDAPWIGTHNSFNSPSESPTLSNTDSNQQLSLTDQLRIDVRSLEIDLHWIPSPRKGGFAVVVCHGTDEHGGCTTERTLTEVLEDLQAWLRANPDQVLLLYVEDDLGSSAGHPVAAAELDAGLRAGDGSSLIYRPSGGGSSCEALPLDISREDVRAAGAQVVIVSGCGSGAAWRSTIFDWGPSHVETRPRNYGADCASDYSRATYDSTMVRYYEDSTWVTTTASRVGAAGADDGITPATAARMARCGVDLLGLDQILPDDGRLEALVWSWAPSEPGTGDCSVQRPDGRWEARDCGESHPAACRAADGSFGVSTAAGDHATATGACAPGTEPTTPRTGRENHLLQTAAAGAEIWLGQTRSGSGWTASDAR